MTDLSQLAYAVIDDDRHALKIFEVLLKRLIGSDRVILAQNGPDLFDRLDQQAIVPDVFFVDIVLYPSSGYDILNQIRADDRYRSTTIIAITAFVVADEVAKIEAADFDGLFSKPIIRSVFPQLLEKVVAGEKIWYVA